MKVSPMAYATISQSDLLRVITKLTEAGATEAEARQWASEYRIPGYGGKTPEEVAVVHGVDAVLDFIEALQTGVYA